MLQLMLLLSLACLTLQKEEVHVSQNNGSDTSSCGSKFSPCKTLKVGIDQVANSGKLYITGNHDVKATIKLTKSVSLIGYQGAIISRRNEVKVTHVFEVSSKINITFELLKIRQVGLIDVKASASIEISKCWFEGESLPIVSRKLYYDYFAGGYRFKKTVRSSAYIQATEIRKYALSIYLKINSSVFTNTSSPVDTRDSTKLSIKLSIIRSQFINAKGMFVDRLSTVVMQNIIFHNSNGFTSTLVKKAVRIQRVEFTGTALSNLYLKTTSLVSKLTIFESSFEGRFTLRFRDFKTVDVKNCVFTNNTVQNFLADFEGSNLISITNLTIQHNTLVRAFGAPLSFREVKSISIHQSKFVGNTASDFGGAISTEFYSDPKKRTLVITESLFDSNVAEKGGALNVNEKTRLKSKNDRDASLTTIVRNSLFTENQAKNGGALHIFGANVIIINCKFLENSAGANGGAIITSGKDVKRFLTIKHSMFKNCSAGYQGGAVLITENSDFQLQNSLLQNNKADILSGGIHIVSEVSYKTAAIINQSSLVDCSAPSIYLETYLIKVIDTVFNVTDTPPISHLKLNGDQVLVNAIRTHVRYPRAARSSIVLKVLTSSWTSVFNISNGIDVFCSKNFKVKVHSQSLSGNAPKSMELNCNTCPNNMYTLTNDFRLKDLSTDILKDIPKCLKCPSGAICDGQVKVLDDYWGKKVDNELTVMPCPQSYCCSAKTTPCTGYNTCAGPRTGTLCGTCDTGYVQNYMGDNCVLKEEGGCDLLVFLNYFVLVSLAYTIILTFPQLMINGIKGMLSRFKKSTAATDPVVSENEVELSMAAFFTIVIYYLQLASLVHVKNTRTVNDIEEAEGESEIAKIILEILNFKLSLEKKICPVDNLNLIDKLFFNIGLKLCTLLHLAWIMLLWKSLVWIGSMITNCHEASISVVDDNNIALRQNECDPSEIENAAIENNISESLPFPTVVKVGFVKLTKLNFTSSINILLQLIHCQNIGDQQHLYVYGDYICYSWWQILVATLLLPTIALFPTSFGISLDLLKTRKISTNLFLLSCGLPPVAIALQLKNRFGAFSVQKFTEEDERYVEEVLQLEEELYKPDNNSARWPVVQLHRNLLIVILDIFIINREYKTLCFIAIFVAFALHDRYRMPFKHPYLNQLQRLTSVCLFLISLCSVPSAFSSVGDIMAVPHMEICLAVLRYLEYFLYALPPLSLALWKLRDYRQGRKLKNKRDEEEDEKQYT